MMTASTPPPQSATPAASGTAARPGITAGRDRPRRSALAYLPAVAGVGYLVAWLAGLAAWPANLALNATSAQVATSHQAHHAAAATQYLLVEGLAGLLLGVVLACAVVSARRGRLVVHARPAAVLGGIAVVISVGQCVLGLLLVAAATGHDVSRAGDLYGLVNRLDGVKMLALAGTAGYLASRLDPARPLPRWLRVTAVVTAVALVASGVTYLLLANALAGAVYVAGPLLLIWVTGTGLWLTVAARRGER
jgi:hypothetical protein